MFQVLYLTKEFDGFIRGKNTLHNRAIEFFLNKYKGKLSCRFAVTHVNTRLRYEFFFHKQITENQGPLVYFQYELYHQWLNFNRLSDIFVPGLQLVINISVLRPN